MKITTPKSAFRFFKTRLSKEVEEFWAAALSADKDVTAAACLFRGTVDQCMFHPRDVFRFAILHNASSVMVAHNHPSGNIQPSDADIRVTGQLLSAASLLEMPLTDHLIVGGRRYYSFMQDGRIRGPSGLTYPELARY
jgi:DNA repair protein RadC